MLFNGQHLMLNINQMLHQVDLDLYIHLNILLLVIMNRPPPTQTIPPAYPSSSKKAKDWDKLEVEIKKEEKEEKLEGDAALNQ